MRSGQREPLAGRAAARGGTLPAAECPVQSAMIHLQVNTGVEAAFPCLPASPAELWPRPLGRVPVHPSVQGQLCSLPSDLALTGPTARGRTRQLKPQAPAAPSRLPAPPASARRHARHVTRVAGRRGRRASAPAVPPPPPPPRAGGRHPAHCTPLPTCCLPTAAGAAAARPGALQHLSAAPARAAQVRCGRRLWLDAPCRRHRLLKLVQRLLIDHPWRPGCSTTMARVEPLLESAGSALEDLGDELGVSTGCRNPCRRGCLRFSDACGAVPPSVCLSPAHIMLSLPARWPFLKPSAS